MTVEAKCRYCGDDLARYDHPVDGFCSEECVQAEWDLQHYGETPTCSYCGDPCDGRYCSSGCRRADESDRG